VLGGYKSLFKELMNRASVTALEAATIYHVTASEVGIKPPLLSQPELSLLSFVF
jgi:hypothetical protein